MSKTLKSTANNLPDLGTWAEYTALGGDIITHIEVVTMDYLFLDYFSFRV